MEKKTIKELRLQHNLSQNGVAEYVGVSTGTLARYERGESFPTVPVIYKLEELFGVPFHRIDFMC